MDGEWKKNELGADQFIASLPHCETELKQQPEDAFQDIIAPLIRRYADLAKNVGTKKKDLAIPNITGDEVEAILLRYDELLGRPQDDGTRNRPKCS